MRISDWISVVCSSYLYVGSPRITSHAIAIWGEPTYGPDFQHLDYVDPDAPKGGTIVLSWPAPFDKLNPFTVRGTAAPGMTLVYETLMAPTADEQSTYYGLKIGRAHV